MRKIALFGAGKLGTEACAEYGNQVECIIDNNKSGQIVYGKEVISLEQFVNRYDTNNVKVVLCVYENLEIIEQLHQNKICDFEIYHRASHKADVSISKEIAHGEWISKLKSIADKEGFEILEIGSRVVTGANYRSVFEKANYTGFDLYVGENVDVTGDAHKLTQYFDKQFDLIFCSAVFEHFSMPWIVADEMIKLCKKGGYIFIETHYSYSNHERPWHFFQFSEQALKVLFSEKRGMKCIEAGVSNPIVGWFTNKSSEYLRRKFVSDLYCHSEYLGQKIEECDLNWTNNMELDMGTYPSNRK